MTTILIASLAFVAGLIACGATIGRELYDARADVARVRATNATLLHLLREPEITIERVSPANITTERVSDGVRLSVGDAKQEISVLLPLDAANDLGTALITHVVTPPAAITAQQAAKVLPFAGGAS